VTRGEIRPGGPIRGECAVPGDKSITQRAILLGAMSAGPTRIVGANPGRDAAAAVGMMRALGVRVTASARGEIVVHGGAIRESDRVLDARNSGTALRLAMGLLAARPFLSILTGDASIRRRPVARVVEPLRALGAEIHARDGGRHPPVVVQGRPLRGAAVVTSIPSAQVKSAVLLAGIQAAGVTSVREPAQTRDHTERMLPLFGAGVERDATAVRVRGPATLHPAEIRVPGDLSAAAFVFAAAALVPRSAVSVTGVGVNPTRTAFLARLERMGAVVERDDERMESGEPVATVTVRAGTLKPLAIGAAEIPGLIDELPLLAVLAAFAEGRSEIRGAGELRVKESDRLSAVTAGLRAIGGDVEELPDGWIVKGRGRLKGGTIDAQGDHRVAMAFLVAGLRATGGVVVSGVEAAAVSDPGFLTRLRKLRS
jgi:3-phosphoshikimate 1-carboxyvinyltransferase